MKVDFEGMVTLIHNYQIKGANARVEQKEEELSNAQTARWMLKQDDSEARKLAQAILDLAEKQKASQHNTGNRSRKASQSTIGNRIKEASQLKVGNR